MLTFPNIMLEICEKYLTELVSSKTLHYPPICELKEATNKMIEPSDCALGGIIPAHGSDGRPQREEVGNLSSKLVYRSVTNTTELFNEDWMYHYIYS